MLSNLIEFMTEGLMKLCVKTGRVLHITGTGGPDDIYLIRYYLVKSKYFNVFIHQFLRSDRDDMHDHPWSFMTYLVHGAYTEYKWNHRLNKDERTRRMNYISCRGTYVRLNRLVFRRATDQHKVLVDKTLKFEERALAPLTICVTGTSE